MTVNAASLRLARSGNHHELGLFGIGARPPRPPGWGDFENAAPIDRLDLPGEVRRRAGVRTAAELVPVDES